MKKDTFTSNVFKIRNLNNQLVKRSLARKSFEDKEKYKIIYNFKKNIIKIYKVVKILIEIKKVNFVILIRNKHTDILLEL